MSRRNGLSTGDVARGAGIPQQTLISWDRAGVLKAARPGRRSSSRAPRVYDEAAVTAALFATSAMRMGFKGDLLRRMIAMVQAGERETLEAAAIFTGRYGPGLMSHYFIPDLEDEDDQRWIRTIRERGALVDGPTSLWTIREYFLPQARRLIQMGDRSLVESLFKEIP